jgi:hypothetical protein
MVLLKQKEVVCFNLLTKKVIVALDFAANMHEEREQLTRNKGSGLWKRQHCPLIPLQRFKGFKARPDSIQ